MSSLLTHLRTPSSSQVSDTIIIAIICDSIIASMFVLVMCLLIMSLVLIVAKREEEQYRDHKDRKRESVTQMLHQQRPTAVGKSPLAH